MKRQIFFAAVALAVLTGGTGQEAAGAEAAVTVEAKECPTLPAFVKKLGEGVPDLGGGAIFDEQDAPIEQLGSQDCPTASATQCQKLSYMLFMLKLMDMSPDTFRRLGIAAFLANLAAEDSGMGDKCSAENISYGGNAIRKQFPALSRRFCRSDAPGLTSATAAGIVASNGECDTSDDALRKLAQQLIRENSDSLAKRSEYTAKFAPIVTRMYRYNTGASSDEDAFRYRGRGFIQITGKSNYEACQADVGYAAKYLEKEPNVSQTAEAMTGVDWSSLNVVTTPEAVSQNRFVAAFCAASYWNRSVAAAELIWTDQQATFKKIVSNINRDVRKGDERYPGYKQWCSLTQCPKNRPNTLDVAAAFAALAGLARDRAPP